MVNCRKILCGQDGAESTQKENLEFVDWNIITLRATFIIQSIIIRGCYLSKWFCLKNLLNTTLRMDQFKNRWVLCPQFSPIIERTQVWSLPWVWPSLPWMLIRYLFCLFVCLLVLLVCWSSPHTNVCACSSHMINVNRKILPHLLNHAASIQL